MMLHVFDPSPLEGMCRTNSPELKCSC